MPDFGPVARRVGFFIPAVWDLPAVTCAAGLKGKSDWIFFRGSNVGFGHGWAEAKEE